ncbi:DUF1565 domain-containing protein [Massilia sp. H-1]|nr:DUF1565 domain-containing protein [Massilia sp. H-1]
MKLPRFLPTLVLAAAPAAAGQTPLPLSSTTYNYYVSTTGSDSNPGTLKQPFQTILRASKVALPGTTIHVLPGVYLMGFKTSMSGTDAQRIYYVSTVKWGARLVPPMSSETKAKLGQSRQLHRHHRLRCRWQRVAQRHQMDARHLQRRLLHRHQGQPRAPHRAEHAVRRGRRRGHRGRQLLPRRAKRRHRQYRARHRPRQLPLRARHLHQHLGQRKNNIVHNIGGAAIQLWHDANNVVISNNTVAASMTGILVGGGDFYHTRGPNDYTSVHNNIVYDNKYGISEQGETGPNNTYRNNLVFQSSTADWQLRNGLAHTGTIAQSPEFVRYARRGGSDFRLRSNSPTIGKGSAELAPADRCRLSKMRVRPNGVDIGAYQFN